MSGAAHDRLARLSPQQRELLLRRLAQTQAPAPAAIPRRAQPGVPLPLSPAQARLWFFERLQPGSSAYHVYGYYRLRGALDVAALEQAFALTVQRHDALRTSFGEVDGEPRQTVAASLDFRVAHTDLSSLPPAQREAQLRMLADAEAAQPFDLSRAPLLRVRLVRMDAQEHVLLVVLHHIVGDAWSRGVLFGDVAAFYAALCAGTAPGLPEPVITFGDAVLWQREPAQLQQAEAQLAFWRDALADASGVLQLPTDRPRGPTPGGRGARHHFRVPQSIVAPLVDFARAAGATPFMALLAAFQALLGRWSGQTDVVVGSPVANRPDPALEPLIGLFVNTLALRADLTGEPSFRELLARTRTHCLGALEHAQVPLERVIEALRVERVPGRTPLFQAMFVLQNAGMTAGGTLLPGIDSEWLEPDVDTARFELTLSLAVGPDGVEAVLDYDRDLFDAATIARLAQQYARLLEAAVAAPDTPFTRLPLLSAAERAELLALGDGGAALARDDEHLWGLVAAQAQRTPEAIALIAPGETCTYAQLRQRVVGLAACLRNAGVGAEARVGVLADRSADAVIAVLGVLAAGGAYVPLDPGHPDERLALLLADAGIAVLVAPPALLPRARAVGGERTIVAADASAELAAPLPLPRATDAAYVIYTSGSTGTPKGVVIEQRGAVNLARGFMARHEFRDQRLLMIPPLVFDASVGDVFPVLASGSALVLHPAPAELGPFELEAFCREHGVSAIDAPASLWRRWSEGWAAAQRREPLPALRLMMIGGESVPLEQVRRFAGVTRGRVDLVNHYGPTEASVCAALLATRDGTELTGLEMPIGRPLPGVRLYVLDAYGALAPRGVVGEVFIAGAGVARGYLHAPEFSAERFVRDPFVDAADARMYRSGDLARWNADGTLQFLGRRDDQVKLRGFRIELGEVEAALASVPGVRACAALLREDTPGDKRLVAYVVGDVAAPALREQLATRLPEALLPSAYVPLPALPLTVNGKVDRRALPKPAPEAGRARTLRAPADATEALVLECWREVLGHDDISTDDDFFALGGDSLATLPLVFKLKARCGVELPLASVFAAPTVAGIARAVEALRAGAPAATLDLKQFVELPPEIDPSAAAPASTPREAPQSVLVTGATGFLGAYLVRELLDTTHAELLCLVRADSAADGLRRVRANLESYGLWRSGDARRLVPVPGDLAAPRLGLDAAAFDALAQRADVIFHNGGQVNFLAPYATLAPANVAGTQEVLRLATRTRVKPVHLVSTLGLYLTPQYLGTTVRESDPAPGADQHGGYNQSKWVGEQLALAARARGLPVAIYRPARITGDSRDGTSNLGDYFNAWLKGCVQLGLAPHLPDETFDMAPVDYVARAIVRLALGAGDPNGQFHFYNGQRLPVPAAVAALRAAGLPLREVPYPEWRRTLQAAASASRDNALAPFAANFPEDPDPREPVFDCTATHDAVARCGITCPPADVVLFSTYLRFLQRRGFFPARALEVEA